MTKNTELQNFKSLDWLEIINHLQSFATSGAAKLCLSQTTALKNAQAATGSFTKTLAAQEILAQGARPFFESLDLFETWHSRLKRKAVLKTLEIKDVRQFCLETLALLECIKSVPNELAEQLRLTLLSADEPLSAIDQIMTPRGEIRMDASETLYRLFKEKESLTRQVESTLDRLVKAHEMSNLLQDKYVTTREGRWVLPIRGGMQHYLPGVIHGSSQTKQTVFIEPEAVVPFNNRLRQIEVDIEDEIERLLTQLSQYLWGLAAEFEQTRDQLLATDIWLAKAQLAEKIQGKAIDFSSEEIYLLEAKHPLLVLSGKPVVANTVRLDSAKRILLLSGPNAGGKTVLLKTIGLAAQMARCGLLCAVDEGSKLPFFACIQLGIGDSQNVGEELSTFAAHLKVLNLAAQLEDDLVPDSHLARVRNLVLVDEICGSTDPEEGSSLARSFIERFCKNGIFAVITSHLGPLKTGWLATDPILNGSLEYDLEHGKPTYQFLSGIPGDSLAIQTAKRVGIEIDIVNRAIELLSPATRAKLAGLEEIDKLKIDIQNLREHLKKDSQKAKVEKEKYELLIKNFEREKENLLRKTRKEAEKKIEELLSASKAEDTFKRHRTLQEIKIQLPEIIKSRPGQGATTQAIETAQEFSKRYPPGSKVFVASLQQDGIVQSQASSKGEVLVLANSLRLSVPWQDLKPPHHVSNPTADLIRRSHSSGHVAVALQDTEKTLDLRGKTVEEAIGELEQQLDRSCSRHEDRIKVIHGHGTDALKKAVRTYLSRSAYVKKWKAGSPEQGGDGVTWAELSSDS